MVGKLVKKIGKRQLYTKEKTIHKTIQRKHRIHKIENRHKNKKTNIKRILNIISRVIRK
jgi:hypothetical protein